MNLENMGIKTCIKCGEGGNLLVCRSSHCAVIIHESCCAGNSLQVHDRQNFFCPYCLYKQSVAECSQAKQESLLAERDLALFLGPKMSLNQEHEPNITKDKQTTLHNDEEHGNQENGRKNWEMVQFVQSRTDLDNSEHDGSMKKMRIGERFLTKCGGGSNIAVQFNSMTSEENYVLSRWKGKVLAPVPLSSCKANARLVVMHDNQSDNCNLSEKSISSTSEGDGVEMNEEDSEGGEGCSRLAKQRKNDVVEGDVSANRDNGCNWPNAENAGWIDKPSKKIPDGVRFRRRKRIRWSAEEEEMLKKGVLFFSSSVEKNLPWRKILVYGNAVFHQWRTPLDLQSKWKIMSRKEHPKSNEA